MTLFNPQRSGNLRGAGARSTHFFKVPVVARSQVDLRDGRFSLIFCCRKSPLQREAAGHFKCSVWGAVEDVTSVGHYGVSRRVGPPYSKVIRALSFSFCMLFTLVGL